MKCVICGNEFEQSKFNPYLVKCPDCRKLKKIIRPIEEHSCMDERYYSYVDGEIVITCKVCRAVVVGKTRIEAEVLYESNIN